MRIIFMGTPDFAIPSLEILLRNNYDVLAVITAPDKPAGRGQTVQFSPVKKFSLEKNLRILQPKKLKDETFFSELKKINPNLQIIVAFRMLPESVWKLPKMGTVNLHASLLPHYRGAAPINWAIINGEKETGVTTFFLRHEIDTGDIVFQEKIPIGENDTAGTLHDKLQTLGAELVLKTVRAIEKNDFPKTPQQEIREIKSAPKISKEDCRINWNQPTKKIYDFIRGLSPHPCAWTVWNEKVFKIYFGNYKISSHDKKTGELETDNRTYLKIFTADGWMEIIEIQLEGKKRMHVDEFLRGYKFY